MGLLIERGAMLRPSASARVKKVFPVPRSPWSAIVSWPFKFFAKFLASVAVSCSELSIKGLIYVTVLV